MQAQEKNATTYFTKEIEAILKKRYCSNINFYPDCCDLANHIMNEIIKLSQNNNRNINKQIGLDTAENVCKFLSKNNELEGLVILTLEIHGINFLGNNFGQNAIFEVLKKVIDVASKIMTKEDKCYQNDEGKLVFVITNNKTISPDLCAKKILSAINSTMILTHNHLFTVKADAEFFYAKNAKEAKKIFD